MPKHRHDTLNVVAATGLAAAVAGIALPRILQGDKPVGHANIPALLTQYAAKIARIPVTDSEITEARKAAKNYWGKAKQVKIDKQTHQAYNVLHDDDPSLVNVLRAVPARDGSGKYLFSVRQRLDARGNLDPNKVVAINAEVKPARGEVGNLALDIYDRDAGTPTAAGSVALKMARNWGAEITNDHYIVADMSVGPNSATFGDAMFTTGRFNDIRSFLDQTVTGAASRASISKIETPKSFQKPDSWDAQMRSPE